MKYIASITPTHAKNTASNVTNSPLRGFIGTGSRGVAVGRADSFVLLVWDLED